MTKKNKLPASALNRARPLADRIDLPPDAWTMRGLGCKLTCRNSGQSLHWPSPIYSRLGTDIPNPMELHPTLEKLRRNCGISVVEPQADLLEQGTQPQRSNQQSSGADRSMDDGLWIQPVFVDEPIDLQPLMHAEQIELQFIPCHYQATRPTSYRADRWIPTLPSDLSQVDRMARRVELLRHASDQPKVVLGGAIAAGSVYEDVRFLIDSGLDYVNVLSEVAASLRPAKSWSLQPIDYVIETARRAIDDSGVPSVGLLVSGPIRSLDDGIRMLSLGVDAFSIDSWLIQQQSESATALRANEDYSSFLSGYSRQSEASQGAPRVMDGLVLAAENWVEEFCALRRFFEI
ncbi:MAG: hypothetical protein NTV29_12670 [Planctomycetota bacterium]|jgi:hypothetical protein|nr:hypothetical protein [Planctomycetota bacterium]